MTSNTLNVCLTHKEVPVFLYKKADIVISSDVLLQSEKSVFIDKNFYGKHGVVLSEYAQLFFLLSFLQKNEINQEYIRIFHYRRFVSVLQFELVPSKNLYWSFPIDESKLSEFDADFGNVRNIEIFNTPIEFQDSLMSQYQREHYLTDLLFFSEYLIEENILTTIDVTEFLMFKFMIPACSVGVYHKIFMIEMLRLLFLAAGFRDSKYFIRRDGYQERSLGFLLERLQSFLIFKYISTVHPTYIFGKNIVLSGSIVAGTYSA